MYMQESKVDSPALDMNPFLVAGLVLTILGTLQLGLLPARLLSLAQSAAQAFFVP